MHALAVIMARGEISEHYCSRYYWMEQWTLAYYRTIYPVPHHSTWESSEIPEEIRYQVVLPPYVEKKKEDYKLLDSRLPENIGVRKSRSFHH